MKKLERFIKVFAIIAIIFGMFTMGNGVLAANDGENKSNVKGIGDIINAGIKWTTVEDKNMPKGTEVGDFVTQFVGIGRALVIIGIITIMIVTLIMGIKWIVATPEKQAKLKEQLIGLVVATVVIFGAVGIWNFVRGIMGNVEEKISTESMQSVVYFAEK